MTAYGAAWKGEVRGESAAECHPLNTLLPTGTVLFSKSINAYPGDAGQSPELMHALIW